MHDHRNIPPDLPFITTRTDLEERDATCPALLEVPSPMVAGVWWISRRRLALDDLGELCRGLELAIHGLGCALEGEPGSEDLPFGLEQARRVMTRLFTEDGQPRRPLLPELETPAQDDHDEDPETGGGGGGGSGPVLH